MSALLCCLFTANLAKHFGKIKTFFPPAWNFCIQRNSFLIFFKILSLFNYYHWLLLFNWIWSQWQFSLWLSTKRNSIFVKKNRKESYLYVHFPFNLKTNQETISLSERLPEMLALLDAFQERVWNSPYNLYVTILYIMYDMVPRDLRRASIMARPVSLSDGWYRIIPDGS